MPGSEDTLIQLIRDSGADIDVVIPNNDSSLWTYYLITLVLPFAIFFLIAGGSTAA